jgi:RNA:NAD 2'-phosphotransferase (TPT1/KptA family)/ADP-ribose pyrophosphatase YjhB (NUDIX family)
LPVEHLKVHKTLAFLLRHRPDIGRLVADDEGFYAIDDVCEAVCRLLRARLTSAEIVAFARSDQQGSFEVSADRIRIASAGEHRVRRPRVPDILFIPSSRAEIGRLKQEPVVRPSGAGPLRLYPRESQAWLAAHRRHADGDPEVLYVDALRAMREGVRFAHVEGELLGIPELPTRYVLNLKRDFGLQVSAGGFLVRRDAERAFEVALVRVRRRSGVTWEVAKGKVELGESPVDTALRELREEMGVETPLEVVADLGVSHYGFCTPGGEPRLKVLHLFVLEPRGEIREFNPLAREGIEEVAFFTPDEAVRRITHGSLREPIRRLRRWLAACEASGRGLGSSSPESP